MKKLKQKKVNKGTPTTADVNEWIRRLEAAHGDAKQALDYSSPLELLVALILAAQCTDERVNQVTKSLFKKYRDAEAYAEGSPGDAGGGSPIHRLLSQQGESDSRQLS